MREFCEDRGFILAVVSLPPFTFKSGKADVKASSLFMRKFSDAEKADYEAKKKAAAATVKQKHAKEIGAEVSRLEQEIEVAQRAKDKQSREAATKELARYQSRMADVQTNEARTLLKEWFSYPVFLYDARKVGITATGDEDDNELYPNPRKPGDVVKTCLELYREFVADPDAFSAALAALPSGSQRVLVVSSANMPRWDIKTARATAFRIAHPTFRPLGDFCEEATELVRPSDEPEKDWPVYGVNNQNGVFFSHDQKGKDFNAPYKRIKKDWFFHNPTRANVGSLGRVPDVPPDAITSPEYQVWRITKQFLPEFLEVLIRSRFFLDLVEIHRVGAVKERLYTENLLEIPVPVLTEQQQLALIAEWRKAQDVLAKALQDAEKAVEDFDKQIRAIA